MSLDPKILRPVHRRAVEKELCNELSLGSKPTPSATELTPRSINYKSALLKIPRTTVLTATCGRSELRRAVESVQLQSVPCTHYLIIDGKEQKAHVEATLEPLGKLERTYTLTIPHAARDFGGTPYAIGSLIARSQYVTFLDDDNWYEPPHIEHMQELVDDNLDFGIAGRLLWSPRKRSLNLDPEADLLVDTSCFFFPNKIAKQVHYAWLFGGYKTDRSVLRALKSLGYKGIRSPGLTVTYTVRKERDHELE